MIEGLVHVGWCESETFDVGRAVMSEYANDMKCGVYVWKQM